MTLGFGSGIISGPRWAMVLKSTDRVSILLSGMDRFREADKSVGASAVAVHTIDVDQDILTTSRLPELALGPHGCQQADTLGVKYVTTADATGRKNPHCQSSGGTRDASRVFRQRWSNTTRDPCCGSPTRGRTRSRGGKR